MYQILCYHNSGSYSRFFLIKFHFGGIMHIFIYFRCFLLFFVVLLRFIYFSFTQLPYIVSLYALNSLSQCIGPAVLMIGMFARVFMKYYQCFFRWIFSTMQVPIMTCIFTLNGYIHIICHNHIEIITVYII